MAVAKMILCKGNGSPYLNCVGKKSETEFYISRSLFAYFPAELHTQVKGKIATIGKIPYCKDCIKKIFDLYYDGGKNSIEGAVYYTCQKLDIPFIVELYEATMDIYRNEKNKADILNIHKTFIYKYIANLNTNSNKYKEKLDFSYSDSTLSNLTAKIEARELEKKDLDKFKLDWGVQEENDDYALLEYDFYELTDGKTLIKSQEMLYRDLCLARLSKRKAEQSKDGDVQKIQKQILDLMKTLRIDNFSEQKELSVIERMLETRIAIQEKEKPASYYDDIRKNANADYLGKGKYFYDHIYRSIKNQFVKNKQYNIIPKDKDTMSDADYEKIMESGLDRKED